MVGMCIVGARLQLRRKAEKIDAVFAAGTNN